MIALLFAVLLLSLEKPALSRPAALRDGTAQGRRRLASAPLLPPLDQAKGAFLAEYGQQYGYGGRIDELYAKEILPRLPADQHYLDYTGASLYWNSQVAAFEAQLIENTYGNPHSGNPSSARTTAAVNQTRFDLLAIFGAAPDDYDLVYTRSATGALQVLGEAFPWTGARGRNGSYFVYLTTNHKSVVGIRQYVSQRNATWGGVNETEVEAWLAANVTEAEEEGGEVVYSLFAYPAYDNYAGAMYPLDWVQRVKAKSSGTRKWLVLLDAAAFAPSHRLNLTETPADFVDLSMYKLFGYPTGIGALIVRKEVAKELKKVYWGGGSAEQGGPRVDWYTLANSPERFEDGSLPFLEILALRHGLDVYAKLGGVGAIQAHTTALGEWLSRQAAALAHSNGAPLLKLYGRHNASNSREVQGPTLNFQILDPRGTYQSWIRADSEMAAAGLHIRSGCACNPGSCYANMGVRDEEVRELTNWVGSGSSCIQTKNTAWEFINVDRPKKGAVSRLGRPDLETVTLPLGSLRASLGYMSRFEDAYALLSFLKTSYTDRPANASAVDWTVYEMKWQGPAEDNPNYVRPFVDLEGLDDGSQQGPMGG